ncbi:uncharacterized protein LOC131954887 [Physella acuta]|uniref:uncharacterized protein LOC131954887 n=1 Tax=Physella acuta TaxID=109671 RepID=UPI0027DB1086|nr:uncharacterized protein LOC131954887 [Physella acuta]
MMLILLIVCVVASSLPCCQACRCDTDVPSRPVPGVGARSRRAREARVLCGAGEYLRQGGCVPCPDGTFMTSEMSKDSDHVECVECLKPEQYEVIKTHCTPTRDTEVTCADGTYNKCYRDFIGKCSRYCERCDVCGLGSNLYKKYELQPCKGDNNTVCCPRGDMVVINGDCQLPLSCGEGFYKTRINGVETCLKCDVCGEGNHKLEPYVVRACNQGENTICCPEPDMVLRHGSCVRDSKAEVELSDNTTNVNRTTEQINVDNNVTTVKELTENQAPRILGIFILIFGVLVLIAIIVVALIKD